MLITCGGNILIRDSDAARVLFTQHGASERPFRMVYEVSAPCFITSKLWAFPSPADYTTNGWDLLAVSNASCRGGVADEANKSSVVFQRMIVAV